MDNIRTISSILRNIQGGSRLWISPADRLMWPLLTPLWPVRLKAGGDGPFWPIARRGRRWCAVEERRAAAASCWRAALLSRRLLPLRRDLLLLLLHLARISAAELHTSELRPLWLLPSLVAVETRRRLDRDGLVNRWDQVFVCNDVSIFSSWFCFIPSSCPLLSLSYLLLCHWNAAIFDRDAWQLGLWVLFLNRLFWMLEIYWS